jgi:dihydroorotate dehydrogenase (NAD+) catalytic subunit
MNAAGSLGFASDVRSDISPESFGAFVTNAISVRARRAASGPRLFGFPGGVLLHSGHPNPGLSSVIKNYAAAWARSPLPVIVHLLSAKAEELHKALPRIEELENVLAIELGVEEEMTAAEVKELAFAASGELPLIIQLGLRRAAELAEAALEGGAAAISLGPPRGTLPGEDGALISGRLYGPAQFPQALAVVVELTKIGIPVIAAGGVETQLQGEALLAAGALAVQIDIALWKSGSIATI